MTKSKMQIIGGLFIVLTMIGAGLCLFFLTQTDNRNQTGKKQNVISTKKKDVPKKITSPINILVIGIDQRGNKKGRSNTIAVYHLDPADNRNSVLAVPRDTYLQIPGRKMDKINHAYAFGGIDLSRQTLEDFLGIKIDYYLITNFSGFVGIIDRLGGITVFVEKDIRGADIRKGMQKLDGRKALEYVRDRQDPTGDIARVERQQHFMKALMTQIAAYTPKWKLALELPEFARNINTNMTLTEIQAIYGLFEKTDPAKIRMELVPGSFYNHQGISYWKPDKNRTELMVKSLF